MNSKTKRNLVWVGITFVCVILFAVFSFMFITKCVLGISSISQNSLYCYLCVDSNIRNFPFIKVEDEPVFNVSQVSDHNHPASNEVRFVTKATREEINKESKQYLEAIGFTYTTDYKTSVYENYIWFESKTSYVGYGVSAENNSNLSKVSVVEQFKDEFLN